MKTFDLTEENQKLFNDLFEETGYHNYMQLRLIGLAKSKDVITVNRPNAVAKHVGHLPDDVVTILVYEDAFDRLDDKNKRLLIKDAFNLISYDSEKDKINVESDIPKEIFRLRKKYDNYVDAVETSYIVMQQIEDEEKQRKEEEKMRKAAEKAAKKNQG